MAETHKLKGQLFAQLNKWLILLSSQNLETNQRQAIMLLKLRNQFCILMLDSSLYDMRDYSVLEDLLFTFQNCLEKNKLGLDSINVAKQLIALGDFYVDFDKTLEYKTIKKVYNSILLRYLTLNENVDLYYELFYSFSDKADLGYKEYQLIQLFYLQIEVLPINNEKGQMIIVYFIKLFEYLNNNGKCRLSVNQIEIVKSICLRIIMEYPTSDYFYSFSDWKTKKKRLMSVKDNPIANCNLNTDSGDKQQHSNVNIAHQYMTNEIDPNCNMSEEVTQPIQNIKNILELPQHVIEKYDTYEEVCDTIHKSSDYIIKSLLLVIFDYKLKREQKLHFIKKAKEYTSIEQYQFITLNEYTFEVKRLLSSIVNLIEKNKTNLVFTYQFFIYLVLKVAKEKEQNYCVFNHFLSSKKIVGKIFTLSQYCEEAHCLLHRKFNDIIKYILPYHKSSFIFDFIKNLSLSPGQEQKGTYFTNMILLTQNQNKTTKCYFLNQINLVLMLYEILTKRSVLKVGHLIFECSGFIDLLRSDLVKTRFNILQYFPEEQKKKTYLDMLFEIIIKLMNNSTNNEYESLLNSTFFSGNDNPWVLNDKMHFSSNEKTFYINNLFSKQYKNVQYASITGHFYLNILISLTDERLADLDEKVVKTLLNLLNKSFNDAKGFYKTYALECSKQCKNIPLYSITLELINDGIKNSEFTADKSLYSFQEKILKSNLDIRQIPEFLKNVQVADSIFISTPGLNDTSFDSCSSTKSQKAKCVARKKTKERKKTFYHNVLNNPEIHVNVNDSDNEYDKLIEHNLLMNCDISSVISSEEVVLFPKDALLLKAFGIYFSKIYLTNDEFIRMRNYYKHHFENEETNGIKQNLDCSYIPNYPTIIKNFTPLWFYFKGFLMRHDLNFFGNPLFKYTHPYYVDRITTDLNIEKRLFPRRSLCNNIIIPVKNQSYKKMYCELITNKGVIFGHVLIYKHFFYFENLDRQIETNKLDKANKHLFLFCSDFNDFITNPKKIHIFVKNIFQIINRRFLYQFQACEVFLLNGKSYFFNFFTENMKIEFIEELKLWNIDIIIDLKDRFKTRDFTKKWYNGQISNLEYLLFLNKYSSRSYNDTNQYPVFPWLILCRNQTRDLRYTTVAQSEAQKSYLSEKYSLIDSNFVAHYNTHFSNSALVLYYLVRLNPFTNNQVIFQSNKLETPNRQFNSLEETFSIIETVYDSREAIPEFFLIMEMFINMNCVQFGFRTKDKRMIHNLIPLNNQSPIKYLIDQKKLLNSNATKESFHHFINNVFGCGQIGSTNDYNIYEKYCYQELVSLTEKKRKYLNENMDDETIKNKINRKIAKIISFGQTPYKLLENGHLQWIHLENTTSKLLQQEIRFDTSQKTHFQMINLKHKILTIVPATKHNYFCVLMKSVSTYYTIKVLNTSLQYEDKYKPIVINKKFKKLDKFKLFDSPLIIGYKYNPKYIFIEFNMLIFILCRFLDNSIKLFNNSSESISFITDSFVTCILKTKDKHFITGHEDGRIMEWSIGGASIEMPLLLSEEKVIVTRTLMAHKKEVSVLYYDNTLGILISSGNEQIIYIRKYYDFCLVGMIDIKTYYLYEVKLSNFFLYFTMYSEYYNKYLVSAYTLNGVKLYSVDEDYYNNIDIGGNGNILIGNTRENTITILTPYFKAKNVINLEFDNKIEKNRLFISFYYIGSNTIIGAISNDIAIRYSYLEEDEFINSFSESSVLI